ncbi:MAG: hypothetical protein FWB95_02575 [Treponema sp.]|nr:hypothetical protein [Treponema sp.]
MAAKYMTRCVVMRNGKQYKKGTFIEDLSEKEIKQGLAQNWLTPVGEVDDEDGEGTETAKAVKAKAKGGKNNPKKDDDKTNTTPATDVTPTREELMVEAAALEIADLITDEMPVEEIQQMIEEAKAK